MAQSLLCRLVAPRGFATQVALFFETQTIFATGWVTAGTQNWMLYLHILNKCVTNTFEQKNCYIKSLLFQIYTKKVVEAQFFPFGYDTPHFTMPHPTQLCHTPLNYVTPRLTKPHPTHLRHPPLSYATPHSSTPHPTELCHSPLSYATPHWDMPLPTQLGTLPLPTPHPILCSLLNKESLII